MKLFGVVTGMDRPASNALFSSGWSSGHDPLPSALRLWSAGILSVCGHALAPVTFLGLTFFIFEMGSTPWVGGMLSTHSTVSSSCQFRLPASVLCDRVAL